MVEEAGTGGVEGLNVGGGGALYIGDRWNSWGGGFGGVGGGKACFVGGGLGSYEFTVGLWDKKGDEGV